MDLLADVLSISGLKSRLLLKRSMDHHQVLQFPCKKSLGFHVIVQGEVQLLYGKNKKEVLTRGDIVLMSRGLEHSLKGLSKSGVIFVSGVYQLWNEPIHPFFTELPDWWILRSDQVPANDSLFDTLKILSAESVSLDLGSESVMHSLLDILFNLILRKIVKANSAKSANWSRATQDEKVAMAIKLMHSDFSHSWSLEELADKVGLSRAGFAQKFKKALGDTPLNYLTMVRIQQAMRLLSTEDEKIESVAQSVGYADAFSFSKAFKKRTGQSPIVFKRESQISRSDPNRY